MQCPYPMSIPNPRLKSLGKVQRIRVPCGKCPTCQANRRQEWAIRILEESKPYLENQFITLTYENTYSNSNGVPSVHLEHLQKFLKRVRKKLHFKVRFYAVGEYGSKTNRPHYHIMLFDFPNDFISVLVSEWKYGFIYPGEINMKSAMYIAKYHVNKTSFPLGANPSFTVMSRKPGIGANYVERMAKFHSNMITRAFYPEYNIKRRLPRYFKEKLYTEDERNKIAEITSDDVYSMDKIEAFRKKYPGKSYFKHIYDQRKNFDDKFKSKSNFNEKL